MTEVTPKPGERWRFTYEGVVRNTGPGDEGGPYVTWMDTSGLGQHFAHGTWERLPDPEPEWKPGDAVRNVNDRPFIYRLPDSEGRCWVGMTGTVYPDDEMLRPLTRLVPEVKS